ncbi:DUF1579 domain-containing protein [Acidobacteria bacterium AH-259-L09]|nr:DUF1579 domain-containing protein [Acidobacteria bacterium AH-259-L09]
MKHRIQALSVSFLGALLLTACSDSQVERQPPRPGIVPPQVATMDAPPGEQHRHLAKFAGSYVATVRTWEEPNGEPVEGTSISEQRMIMNGRFLEVDDRSEDGTYHWRAVHSFHNGKGFSFGISNQSNAVSRAEFSFDGEGRWIVIGEAGQQPTFKGVGTLTEDGYVYVNYRLGPNGEELGKYREIVYRRRD